MKNDELADKLIVMVAGLAGREIPADPVDPENPEEPTNPSDKPDNSSKNPVNSGKPTISNQTNSSNNGKTDTDKSGRKIVKSASIPNTGAPALG